MVLWSHGCSFAVILLGGKNSNLMFFSLETLMWTLHLSRIMQIFVPWCTKLRSSSLIHPVKMFVVIHAFWVESYSVVKVLIDLKKWGFAYFQMTRRGNFSVSFMLHATKTNSLFIQFTAWTFDSFKCQSSVRKTLSKKSGLIGIKYVRFLKIAQNWCHSICYKICYNFLINTCFLSADILANDCMSLFKSLQPTQRNWKFFITKCLGEKLSLFLQYTIS